VPSERVAAVVVLYHPGPEVVENIRTWADQVAELYAIDNSEAPEAGITESLGTLQNMTYLPMGENRGVAAALNAGAELAVAAGYDFLLTMDQDSRAMPEMVEQMLCCMSLEAGENIGIIAPFHVTRGRVFVDKSAPCEDVMTPMTSGSLLNLRAYRVAGPFRDDLFIDFVDNEYCLRLRKSGFSVFRANRAILYHRVGDTRKYGPFVATNHPPLRRYYKTRNRFLVNRLYRRDFPGHCLFDRVRLAKEVVSILFFEREKTAKFRMMWRGYIDYRHGRFGKYEETLHP
jgi:rhamnosyltransferase